MNRLMVIFCDAMYTVQKGFFNKLAVVQVFLTFFYVISLLFDDFFPWHQDVMPHVRMFLQVISIPTFTLSSAGFFVFFVVYIIAIIATVGLIYKLGRDALNSSQDQEKSYVPTTCRVFVAAITTFWITLMRTFISPFQCDWFTDGEVKPNMAGIFDDSHDCAEMGVNTVVQAVSAIMMLAIFVLMIGTLLAHEANPRSFNALSRISSELDIVEKVTWVVSVVLSYVFRYNAPEAVGGWLLVMSLYHFLTLIRVQPFFVSWMNDLKSGFALAVAAAALCHLALCILDRVLDDLDDAIKLAVTIGALVVVPTALLVGWRISSNKRAQLTAEGTATLNEVTEETTDDVFVEDEVWQHVEKYFVPCIGATGAQTADAHRIEIQSRCLLIDARAGGIRGPPKSKVKLMSKLYCNGLKKNPQSIFLMLAFIRFQMCYKLHLNRAITEKYLDFVLRLCGGDISSIQHVTIWRLRRDLYSTQLAGAEDSGDAQIENKSSAEMQKDVVQMHGKCLKLTEHVWKQLAKGASILDVYSTIDNLWNAEKECEDMYHMLLLRLSHKMSLLTQYSRFLSQVKKDKAAAMEVDDYASMQSKSMGTNSSNKSNSSNRSQGEGGSIRFQRMHKDMEVTNKVSTERSKMVVCTVLLMLFATALLLVYIVLIREYETTLLSLNESGVRRYFTQVLGDGARRMYSAAKQENVAGFNAAKAFTLGKANGYNYIHTNLVHKYHSASAQQLDFYKYPKEIRVQVASMRFVEPVGQIVNGIDVGFRLIQAARVVAQSPIEMFTKFDRGNPGTFPELFYTLENAYMTGKAMDHSTINYVFEASDIAQRMIVTFVVLSSICVVVEFVLVLGIFRRTVERLFESVQEQLRKLETQAHANEGQIVKSRVAVNIKKNKKDKQDKKAVAKKTLEDSDAEIENSDKEDAKAAADQQVQSDNATANASAAASLDSADRTVQQQLLAAFYWTCLVVITVCLCVLCALCVITITRAESSANELNNAGRRRFLDARIWMNIQEMVMSSSSDTSLQGGRLTWMNNTGIIRCILRRAAHSLLSTHYGLMFGGQVGFTDIGLAQNWLGGPVKSFLPEGYNVEGRWPSQVQVPGFEAPPTWTTTGGDYCTPFTWDHGHFLRGAELVGSYGRDQDQDDTYFQPTCLTELPYAKDTLSYTTQRITFFSKNYAAWKCYGFRKDILLCATGNEAQVNAKHPPSEEVKMMMTETAEACKERMKGDAAGLASCSEAEMRTRCKRVVQAREAQCDATDAACLNAAGVHSIKKGDHMTSSLEYYNSNFDSNLKHATMKPQDLITSSGLHPLVMYYASNAVALAAAPEVDLNQGSEFRTYWDRLAKYMAGDSGMEIALGLIKSILIYQHEAISSMRNNTDVTVITFSCILVILLLQCLFLSQRVGTVTRDTYGMLRCISRFLEEMQEIAEKQEADKKAATEKALVVADEDEESDDIGSDSNGELEEEEE